MDTSNSLKINNLKSLSVPIVVFWIYDVIIWPGRRALRFRRKILLLSSQFLSLIWRQYAPRKYWGTRTRPLRGIMTQMTTI
jgi:dolichol kinase